MCALWFFSGYVRACLCAKVGVSVRARRRACMHACVGDDNKIFQDVRMQTKKLSTEKIETTRALKTKKVFHMREKQTHFALNFNPVNFFRMFGDAYDCYIGCSLLNRYSNRLEAMGDRRTVGNVAGANVSTSELVFVRQPTLTPAAHPAQRFFITSSLRLPLNFYVLFGLAPDLLFNRHSVRLYSGVMETTSQPLHNNSCTI